MKTNTIITISVFGTNWASQDIYEYNTQGCSNHQRKDPLLYPIYKFIAKWDKLWMYNIITYY